MAINSLNYKSIHYVLAISDEVPAGSPIRKLILAAVMCIDLVLKE